MKTIKFFIQKGCGACELAKEISSMLKKDLEESKVCIKLYDLADPDNVAEGLFYDVEKTPSVIVEDEDGTYKHVKWNGRTLTYRELKGMFDEKVT